MANGSFACQGRVHHDGCIRRARKVRFRDPFTLTCETAARMIRYLQSKTVRRKRGARPLEIDLGTRSQGSMHDREPTAVINHCASKRNELAKGLPLLLRTAGLELFGWLSVVRRQHRSWLRPPGLAYVPSDHNHKLKGTQQQRRRRPRWLLRTKRSSMPASKPASSAISGNFLSCLSLCGGKRLSNH